MKTTSYHSNLEKFREYKNFWNFSPLQHLFRKNFSIFSACQVYAKKREIQNFREL